MGEWGDEKTSEGGGGYVCFLDHHIKMEFLGRQEVFPPKENVSNKEKGVRSLTHLSPPPFSQAGATTVLCRPGYILNNSSIIFLFYSDKSIL